MKTLFAGIKRKEHYSPNHSTNDTLLLQKTAKELEKLGADYVLYTEDEFLSSSVDADIFFSMARSRNTIEKLIKHEKEGAFVINSTQASINTHRVNMIKIMKSKNIPLPKSIAVKTNSNIKHKVSQVGKNKIWIKRGDVHAIHREDVTLVHCDEELNYILNEFLLRGIDEAVLQEHIEGDVVKFYSVKDTDFFYWYYFESENQYEFNFNYLKYVAEKSAEYLNLKIYGGDAIVRKDGTIKIIDINDWPSFAPVRDEASKVIAQKLYSEAVEFANDEILSQSV